MLLKPSPKSSTQRVREFRARNPGYDAARMRGSRARHAAPVAAHQEAEVKTPLMLPAPQPPEFDLLEQLAAARARAAELELIFASHAAS